MKLLIAMAASLFTLASAPVQADETITITRTGSQPSNKGPAQFFTGSVRVDPLFSANAPSRTSGGLVTFEPGARSAWHTHPVGQILIVTAGKGLAQRWGGPIEEIRPGDVRFEERDDPRIIKPTDAIIRMSATCVCGSDLWPYRGFNPSAEPSPMGHEYCGIVEEVGREVTSVKPGQFVIGSFFASDNTCPICRAGYQSSCQHAEFVGGAQAPVLRVPLADGTLVATPGVPSKDIIPSLLSTSDVFGTGWFAAEAANVKPGMTVAVVGDGAVGLLGVLSAKQMGAGRIIAMSRHEARQKLAREFGASDIVTERGDEGVARIKDLTNGIGADAG